MSRFRSVLFLLLAALPLASQSARAAAAPDAAALIKAALHQWRGDSSYTEITMVIHRPDWQRRSSLVGWTEGQADSLVRFTAPAGDAGNATLKRGPALWLYNPKLGQVIKLPFSMMAQGWAGSDFSYNDLAKTDQIVTDYTHTLGPVRHRDGHTIYTVTCIPKPSAPVVWGKVTVQMRDDHVLLAETWFDQAMHPVRALKTLRIAPIGGRPYPVQMRMSVLDKPGHWTEITTLRGRFNLKLPPYLFTLSNLRNPRPWSLPQ